MSHIELEGVRVHNLKGFDLRIPHYALTVICGVSGSGKSSLAFDTLYAEGQRRYIETFSPYARQFLNQLERPDVDRIAAIPSAVAVRQQTRLVNPRSTIGTRTEILHDLQLLFAQSGQLTCAGCSIPVQSWSPEDIARESIRAHEGARACIAFEIPVPQDHAEVDWQRYSVAGFVRALHDGQTQRIENVTGDATSAGTQIIVDRIRVMPDTAERISEAARQCFAWSTGCHVLVESPDGREHIDGSVWTRKVYFSDPVCSGCRRSFPAVSQDLLRFSSPVGACTQCEGTGLDDNAPHAVCETCQGTRLNEFGRSVRLADRSLPDVLRIECGDMAVWLAETERSITVDQRNALKTVLSQLHRRLNYLTDLGLGYLPLDRSLMSLSGGEARRVVLVSAFGSGLINTLYVLDEPTSGMHATDIERMVRAVRRLKENGNTVVVVEHDLDVIQAADHIVELGPDAGRDGGTVVLEGTPAMLAHADTATGRAVRTKAACQDGDSPGAGQAGTLTELTNWLNLEDVYCHNIAGATVRIPLQTLCAVTGVSGSGKSSLIVDTLFPAVGSALGHDSIVGPGRCLAIDGVEFLSDIRLLEQNPLQRSSRSIPATYLGTFDEIRKLLAATHEARKRSYSAGMFSFNSAQGGRCERCKGQGHVTIDMQFLADVDTVCDNCQGRRFRADVLDVRYRDRSVHEILEMTADEAFGFFHGVRKVQQSLSALRQAGLGYLALAQPVSSLSGGEAQRLRIAALLAGVPDPETPAAARKPRSDRDGRGILFLLDEPSNGLHARDADQLMGCLRQLTQVGHSVVLIEHDARLTEQCDYRIEMGPGAGRRGGQVVFAGVGRTTRV